MTREDRRAKILIVDDNKQNIDLLMDLFKDEYKVAASLTPDRAMKIATSDSPPDIILSDILMPGMDGYELCTVLKKNDKTKEIPIIFITAVSEVMDAAKGFDVGAADYITKPFHPPMVKARVEMQLRLKRKQDLLEKLAFIDPLTEIPNRRRYDEMITQEWNRSRRSGEPLSVMLIDLDHFKEFNDTYGHGKGDEVLRIVAQELNHNLRRAGDFVARFGGEEFVALLPYADEEHVNKASLQIHNAIRELNIPHKSSPVSDHLTVSIGVLTVNSKDFESTQQIFEKVDQIMYEAKRQGRNRVVTF